MFLGIHREDDGDLSSDDSSTPQIKRGLSKFYKGKSQSYTSISDVTCVEDLAKKRDPLNRTKSYGGGLDGDEVSSSSSSSRPPCSSKGKGSRVSCASSIARSNRPPAVPVQHNF